MKQGRVTLSGLLVVCLLVNIAINIQPVMKVKLIVNILISKLLRTGYKKEDVVRLPMRQLSRRDQ